MRTRSLVVALFLLSQLPLASAAVCDSPAPQGVRNDGAEKRPQNADKTLNGLYNAYSKRLSADQQKLLKQAQLAWLKYRKAACLFESSGVAGGSAHAMVYGECIESITQDRIKSLKILAECTEGDLSCPAPR